MKSAGQNSDRFFFDFINQAMLLIDPSRPASLQLMLELFWLANSRKRAALNVFDKLNDSFDFSAIVFIKIIQILLGLALKFYKHF